MDILCYTKHGVISLRTIEEGNMPETRRFEVISFIF